MDVGALDSLPLREDWPRGSTSDDTAQLLLLARVLADGGDAPEFLSRLADELPSIRGSGPSTVAAVEEFRRSGRLSAVGGSTNGAMMRAPALGWAARAPRELAERISRTTHGDDGAVAAACAVAAMASAAVEGAPVAGVIDAGLAEVHGWELHSRLPPDGVPLDALVTLAAVLSIVRDHEEPAAAMRAAVALGGDTDTVAAIAGGILASRFDEPPRIPWLGDVLMPDAALLDRLADGLASARRAG